MLDPTPFRLGAWSDDDIASSSPSSGGADWTLIRARYDAGESAPVLAARHGISVSSIRTKARQQGWRRIDAPMAFHVEDDPDLLEPRPALELADIAWRRMSDAVVGGRLMESVGWFRLHRELRGEAKGVGEALRQDALLRERSGYRPPVLDPAAHPGAPQPEVLHALHGLHADPTVQPEGG